MDLIQLNAKLRDVKGKGAARKLRAGKQIPAIMYGAKTEPVMLSLDTGEFDKVIRDHGSTGLFMNLKVDGDNKGDQVVMLKEMQMDTFGLEYVHVDFHQIDMDTKVTVTIPVEATGISKGVKEGGLLQIIRRELDVVCKPADTPECIEVDITNLDIGDAVHVEDIDLGEMVEIPHEVNFTVVTIVPPVASDKDEVEEDELAEEVGITAEAEEPAE